MNQGDKPITAEESPALVAEAEAILTDTSWLGLMSVNDIIDEDWAWAPHEAMKRRTVKEDK